MGKEVIKNATASGFKFYVTPAVVRESLRNGCNELTSFLDNGFFEEHPALKHYSENKESLYYLCLTLDAGEIETMVKTKELLRKGVKKIYPIIDDAPARIACENLLRNNDGIAPPRVYHSTEFIVNAVSWRFITPEYALGIISKIKQNIKADQKSFWVKKATLDEIERKLRGMRR